MKNTQLLCFKFGLFDKLLPLFPILPRLPFDIYYLQIQYENRII